MVRDVDHPAFRAIRTPRSSAVWRMGVRTVPPVRYPDNRIGHAVRIVMSARCAAEDLEERSLRIGYHFARQCFWSGERVQRPDSCSVPADDGHAIHVMRQGFQRHTESGNVRRRPRDCPTGLAPLRKSIGTHRIAALRARRVDRQTVGRRRQVVQTTTLVELLDKWGSAANTITIPLTPPAVARIRAA